MSSAGAIDHSGSTNTTSTVAPVVLTYNGPDGSFPANAIVTLEIVVTAWDTVGGGKAVWVYDVAVHTFVGATLDMAASPAPRTTATVGTIQATGVTWSISSVSLIGTATRSATGNSIQWSAAVVSASVLVP